MRSIRMALAQMTSGADVAPNLHTILRWIELAARDSCRMISFPENCLYLSDSEALLSVSKFILKERILTTIVTAARTNKIAVLLGGYPERKPRSKKVFNTSLFIDEKGRVLARYRKIHLFDVDIPGGRTFRESRYLAPGRTPVVFEWRGIRIGLAICFDLRFPEHFRRLSRRGAEWLFVPSAFTRETGRVHWHTLLRARAIENLATVIAPAQTGRHPDGRETFGHSTVVGPWGDVVFAAGRPGGLHFLDVPCGRERRLRAQFPVVG